MEQSWLRYFIISIKIKQQIIEEFIAIYEKEAYLYDLMKITIYILLMF